MDQKVSQYYGWSWRVTVQVLNPSNIPLTFYYHTLTLTLTFPFLFPLYFQFFFPINIGGPPQSNENFTNFVQLQEHKVDCN